jgi:SAM-dependent methyltransferase
MQFGTREEFTYRECSACGTLHIATVPADLSRFYPTTYYSFEAPRPGPASDPWLRRLGSRWLVASPDPLARALVRHLGLGRYAFYYWARLCGARIDSAILDVGCGSGALLRRMQRYGFTRLTGLDPFAPAEIDEGSFRLRRTELSAETETYDLIMMNHVLEHLADPAAALALARARLAPRGHILVRLPLAGSFAHREYGPAWFNLDAPRHLVIPTDAGLRRLAEEAGLEVRHRHFDSVDASLLASDFYRRDISGPNFPPTDPATRRRCRERTDQLNRTNEADFGVYILAPIT